MPFVKGQKPPKKGEKIVYVQEDDPHLVDQEKATWLQIHETAMRFTDQIARMLYIAPISAFYQYGLKKGWDK
jgi:hypothetical protein